MVAEVCEPFPVAALPEPLQSFVKNTAAAIGCDPAMVAVPILVAVAAAVGTTRRVEVKPGYFEVCILWAMIIARRGGKKSPALNRALRAVHHTQARICGQVASKLAAKPGGPDESSASENPCRLASRSIPGHIRRLLTTDVSVAGLAEILKDEPRGILVVRDELAGWFADLRKHQGRSDSSQWLSAWSGEPWIIDRKGRDSIYIPAAAVSIIGGIQPGVLPRVITATDMEAGLFDRFLFVVPPPPPADRWTELCEDPEDSRMIDILFGQLYGISDRRDLCLNAQAKELHEEFYNTISQRIADCPEAMATILTKYRAYVPRLAMVLQLVQWAVGDAPQDPIDGTSMKAAIDMVTWFASQARRALDLMIGKAADSPSTTMVSDKNAILEALREIGGIGTARELQRKTGKRFQDAEQILDTLGQLVQKGHVEEVPDTKSGPGRKSPRFRLTK